MNEEKKTTNEVANTTKTHSEKFMNMVLSELSNTGGSIELNSFQKKLVQNYFIKMDQVLKTAEQKRMSKPESSREPIEFSWKNVNLEKLALDVVSFAAVGLDPLQKNHASLVPYANSKTGKYDITIIPEYKGLEVKATKYALNPFEKIVVQLVYENDFFEIVKQDAKNPIENYIFEIRNPFNRGKLIGGFYYVKFENALNNYVVPMSVEAIEKRKPKYASPEFWGGEKDEWKDGKRTGKKEVIAGWYDEMCYKTVCRAAYGSITVDSQKIDEHFNRLNEIEDEVYSPYQIVETKTIEAKVLPTITDQEVIEAIADKMTAEQLRKNYTLSAEQIKMFPNE